MCVLTCVHLWREWERGVGEGREGTEFMAWLWHTSWLSVLRKSSLERPEDRNCWHLEMKCLPNTHELWHHGGCWNCRRQGLSEEVTSLGVCPRRGNKDFPPPTPLLPPHTFWPTQGRQFFPFCTPSMTLCLTTDAKAMDKADRGLKFPQLWAKANISFLKLFFFPQAFCHNEEKLTMVPPPIFQMGK